MIKPKIGFHPIKKTQIKELPNNSNLCIWCKQNNIKNTAHIIIKNLLLTDKPNNKLKESVCIECNSFWGNTIEDWFLKYTPIGQWKENILRMRNKDKSKVLKNFKYVPNFIFNAYYNEWIVVNNSLEGQPFPTQIILNSQNKLKVFNTPNIEKKSILQIYSEFKNVLINKTFTTYLSNIIDKNINPRLFISNGKYILIAKNYIEKDEFIKIFLELQIEDVENLIKDKIVGTIDEIHIHYKWSIKRFLTLSSKIAIEFLTLIKGADFTLSNDFDDIRQSLTNPKQSFDNLSILDVGEKGLKVKRLNYPNWITMAENINSNQKIFIPTLTFLHEDLFTHSIIIYKYKDLICATVKLFGIEHSKIIIARTDLLLDKIYAIFYQLKTDEFFTYESSESVDDYDERILIPYFSEENLYNFK